MWLKSDAKAPFPVLTDLDNGYAMSLGLAFSVGDEMKRMMVSSGWDPSVSQGTDNWTLPIPATFIVGTEGVVHARFVDPDYRTRMAIEDMLAALRSARSSPPRPHRPPGRPTHASLTRPGTNPPRQEPP